MAIVIGLLFLTLIQRFQYGFCLFHNMFVIFKNSSEKLSLERNLPNSRERYKVNGYPTSILVGKDGKVIRADARGECFVSGIWESILDL